jgi:phosphoribosylamine-glycine ligase
VKGELNHVVVSFRDGHAATVVAASPGYPGDYVKGSGITVGSVGGKYEHADFSHPSMG